MNDTKRSNARHKGLAIAARIAAVGGITAFALGGIQIRTAHASATGSATTTTTSADTDDGSAAAGDDRRKLPMEDMAAVGPTGSCGCSPCWGPPAPPVRGEA